MDNSVLRLEKDFQGNFSIPSWNCVEEDGVVFYKKPLFVNKDDWSEFIVAKASIISKETRNNRCLVFATSIDHRHNSDIEKLFWRDNWCNKECEVLCSGEHRFMIHTIFEVPEK